MHDDSVPVAIEDALRSPAFCACGGSLALTTRDASVWLECQAFGRPSRLPAPLAAFLRELVHDRTFVIGLPGDPAPVPGGLPATC